MDKKLVIGALELCDLPDLKISDLHMRVDTGAATSSLHVDNIQEFKKDDENWIQFDIHPDYHNVEKVVRREAKVKAIRNIKTSNDVSQNRYVIDTQIVIGGHCWMVELNLTDRSNMTYLMLLGREAMAGRILVDPQQEYLLK